MAVRMALRDSPRGTRAPACVLPPFPALALLPAGTCWLDPAPQHWEKPARGAQSQRLPTSRGKEDLKHRDPGASFEPGLFWGNFSWN